MTSMMERPGTAQGKKTYRHAEEGLLGLANVTLGHLDSCDERELRKTDERGEWLWGRVKGEHKTL